MNKTTFLSVIAILIFLIALPMFFIAREYTKPKNKPSVASAKTENSQPSDDGQNKPLTNNIQSIPIGASATNNKPTILEPSQFIQYNSFKESGEIQLQDIKIGNGSEVVKDKKVAVIYKGWLTDGKVFDQSRLNKEEKVEPFVFTPGAGEVIQAWEVGLIGMKEGGTRRLIVPPAAGYGEAGTQGIPPNSVLIFDIQVLEVEK